MPKKELDTLKEIENSLKAILADKEGAIKSFEELAESAKKRIEAAALEADKAYNAADETAYHKAIEEKRVNENTYSMYSSKANKLRENPYITKEEFSQIIDRITSTMDDYMTEQLKDYTKKIESLFSQYKELEKMTSYVNDLIALAQKKVYKDPCGIVNCYGEFKPMAFKEMRYTNTTLNGILEGLVKQEYNFNLLCQNHAPEEIKEAEPPRWG